MIFDDSDLNIIAWGVGIFGFLCLLLPNIEAAFVCLMIVLACLLGRLFLAKKEAERIRLVTCVEDLKRLKKKKNKRGLLAVIKGVCRK